MTVLNPDSPLVLPLAQTGEKGERETVTDEERKDRKHESHHRWRLANRERENARNAAWRKANPDEVKAESAAYRKAHPEKIGAWQREHPEETKRSAAQWKEAHPGYGTARMRERVYGFPKDVYDALLEKQGGKCAACGKPNSGHKNRNGEYAPMFVDHDHDTGKVRGLLCAQCNVALGVLEDSEERIAQLGDYLHLHS